MKKLSKRARKIITGALLIAAAISVAVGYESIPVEVRHKYVGEIEVFVPLYKVENARVVADSLNCECFIYRDKDDGALTRRSCITQETCELVAESGYTKAYSYKWWAKPWISITLYLALIFPGGGMFFDGVFEKKIKDKINNI